MQRKSVDVLIVGGGPAGMVAACLLSAQGLETLVIERNEDFHREFRGEILQPRFHRTMKDVGLYDHVSAYPHEPVPEAQVFFEGQRIGGLRLDRLDPDSGTTWSMTQPTLLGALHDLCRERPHVSLWFGASVKAVEPGAARVERDGDDWHVDARVIVGADGRFSAVRRLGGFGMAYEHHDLDVIWFNLPQPERHQHHFAFFLTLNHNYLLLPKYPDLLQCGLVAHPREYATEIRPRPIAALRAELTRAHPAFAEFAAGLTDFSPFMPLKGNVACVRDWARDGLVLVGDAAHTCSPIGGIGVAVAVETAVVASSVIVDCFARGDFSHDRLARVQQLRAPEVRRVHAIQHRGGRVFVRSPAYARRLLPLLFGVATRTGLAPLVARQLIARRRPLPAMLRADAPAAGPAA